MTASIHNGRYTAEIEGDFVVFLIGARINKPWKIGAQKRIAAMPRMQREIAQHPEIGCLHIENFGVLKPVSVQYWRSFEALETFARSSEWAHLPAWREFNQLVNNTGDVGIWHETYRVKAHGFESIYGNMPRSGLAAAGAHVRVDAGSTAARRGGVRPDDVAPIDGY